MFVRGNDWLPDRIQTTATSISPPYLRMDVPHTLHSTPTPTPMTQYTSRVRLLLINVITSIFTWSLDEEGETVFSKTDHQMASNASEGG